MLTAGGLFILLGDAVVYGKVMQWSMIGWCSGL